MDEANIIHDSEVNSNYGDSGIQGYFYTGVMCNNQLMALNTRNKSFVPYQNVTYAAHIQPVIEIAKSDLP